MEEAAMEEEEMDGLRVANFLRSTVGSRNCCSRFFQAVWSEHWGSPMHTVPLSHLLCACHGRDVPYPQRPPARVNSHTDLANQRLFRLYPHPRVTNESMRRLYSHPHFANQGLGPYRNAELEPFFPPFPEVGIDPSTPLDEGLPILIEAAKTRRRTRFDGYADAQPPAPLGVPSHAVVESGNFPLPHDLLLFSVVLPHLALQDVFRARAVCRFWHQTLSSPLHLQRLTQNPDLVRPRLVLQTSTPNFSSCLSVFNGDRWSPNPIPLPTFCLRAAAAGLFCFSFEIADGFWQDRLLLVGNPLTQQWRRLPPVPEHTCGRKVGSKGVACTMWADPFLGCYKIFVLDMLLYIYDSSSGQWEEHSMMPPLRGDSRCVNLCRRECSVSRSGLLHQLSVDGQIVLSYDMKDKCTSFVKTYGPSNMDLFQLKQPYSRLPAVVYCNNRVYVVARMKAEAAMVGGRLPWVVHGPVAIWELHILASGDTGKWGWPVSVAPQELLEGAIAGSDGTDFCVTTDGDNTLYLVLPGGATMLAYDVVSEAWSTLSGCPSAFLISFHPQPYYVPLLWLGPV